MGSCMLDYLMPSSSNFLAPPLGCLKSSRHYDVTRAQEVTAPSQEIVQHIIPPTSTTFPTMSNLVSFPPLTCTTKSRPRKSAMVRGRRVRPQTNLRKRDLSVLEKDSITSQNHWMSGAVGSTPLYVATDFSRWRGMSGLPHT